MKKSYLAKGIVSVLAGIAFILAAYFTEISTLTTN